MKYIKIIYRNIKIWKNKLGSKKRAKKIKRNYTLISNNCWAGLTYEYLNQPFISPTIGLYFMSKEYLKFISRFEYYISQKLYFIRTNESKYYNYLKTIGQSNVIIGKLDDIEIVFLHYKTEKEAYEKWNKRVRRINYDRIIFKFNDQNLCDEEDLERFANLNLKHKLCFTSKKYNYKGFVQIKKWKHCNFVKDDVYCYHKYFNIIDYLNNIN